MKTYSIIRILLFVLHQVLGLPRIEGCGKHVPDGNTLTIWGMRSPRIRARSHWNGH